MIMGPLRSPSASSQGPARAAGFPPVPPLRPPAPVGSGSFSEPPPASCSPPSQGRRRRAGCGGEAGCCAKAAAAAAAAAAASERRSAPPRQLCATAAPPAAQEQPGSHCLPGGADEPRAGARAPGAGTAGKRGWAGRSARRGPRGLGARRRHCACSRQRRVGWGLRRPTGVCGEGGHPAKGFTWSRSAPPQHRRGCNRGNGPGC